MDVNLLFDKRKDTAYTNLPLGAHTDTTYFTDPAGLQMFHLLSHTEGSGGKSLLVDGFKAAHILREENPVAYGLLAKTGISCHASGNHGISITPSRKFPVLNVIDNEETNRRQLLQVRWNPDDRAAVPLPEWSGTISGRPSPDWYAAAEHWNSILKRREMEYWAQLEPGKPLSMLKSRFALSRAKSLCSVFDNWRVLHGRSAFTGKRRMCGGYSKLSVIWRVKLLNRPS